MLQTIYFYFHPTKFGEFPIAASDKGLIHVHLPNSNKNIFKNKLKQNYPSSLLLNEKNSIIIKASEQLDEYLDRKRKSFSISFDIDHLGTKFQNQVWQVLSSIPYGTTLTYKDVALRLQNEGAVRAIGQANKSNPIAIFIPCHRVVGAKKGDLGGYAGSNPDNINLKQQLLNLEVLHKHKKLNDFLS